MSFRISEISRADSFTQENYVDAYFTASVNCVDYYWNSSPLEMQTEASYIL